MTPGDVSRTDCEAGSRPRFSRRSMRPSLPKPAMGLPVAAFSAYTKLSTAANTRASLPSRPVHEAAIRAAACNAGVEHPQLFAGGRIDARMVL